MRIAWFSPLINSPLSSSQLYTRTVLSEEFAQNNDIEIFLGADDYKKYLNQKDKTLSHLKSFHFLRAWERNKQKPFDLWVYQIEDLEHLDYITRAVKINPGICVVHDISLFKLYTGRLSHSTGAHDLNKMVSDYFGVSSYLGNYKIRNWPIEIFSRIYPFGRDVFNYAAGLIVFNEFHREYLKKFISNIPVYISNYPFQNNLIKNKINQSSKLNIYISGTSFLNDNLNIIFNSISKLIPNFISQITWLCSEEDFNKIQNSLKIRNISSNVQEVIKVKIINQNETLDIDDSIALILNSECMHGIPLLNLAVNSLVPSLIIDNELSYNYPDNAFIKLEARHLNEQISLVVEELYRNHLLRMEIANNMLEFARANLMAKKSILDLFEIASNTREYVISLKKQSAYNEEKYYKNIISKSPDLNKAFKEFIPNIQAS